MAAEYEIEKVWTEEALRAHMLVARKDDIRRLFVPVSVSCFNFTPARIQALFQNKVSAAPTGNDEITDTSEITLAFVDSDSVSLLPMCKTLQHPIFVGEENNVNTT